MTAVLQEIIGLLTSGISSLASGLGSGMQALVSNIFLETGQSGTTLSTFGGMIVIFGAISLTIAISKWVTSWLTSWGN